MLPVHFPFVYASNGYECFSLMPDGEDNRRNLLIQGEQIRAPLSSKYLAKDAVLPGGRHEWQYTCETQALLKQLRAFWLDRRGRGLPFWFPTWEFDLTIAPTIPVGFNLAAWDGGYLNSYYTLSPAFRWILAVRGSDYIATKLVSLALDTPTPGWDGLLRSGDYGGGTVPAMPWSEDTGARVLWLRYGRFDTDRFSVDTLPGGGGMVRLQILECNDEAPA